jgi:hypothetical protein
MALIRIDWNPTNRQLQQFGAICLVALPTVAWLWGCRLETVGWWLLAGLVLAVAGLVRPATLKPLFLALSLVTAPIGMAISELVLIAAYFLVLVPFGLAFRVIRRDALQLKLERHRATYWNSRNRTRSPESYYRQS